MPLYPFCHPAKQVNCRILQRIMEDFHSASFENLLGGGDKEAAVDGLEAQEVMVLTIVTSLFCSTVLLQNRPCMEDPVSGRWTSVSKVLPVWPVLNWCMVEELGCVKTDTTAMGGAGCGGISQCFRHWFGFDQACAWTEIAVMDLILWGNGLWQACYGSGF